VATPAKPLARILHAEDQPIVADAIELVLGDAGYAVERAADGVEALDKIKAAPTAFDLLLTDDHMPNMNGVDLVRALRAMNFPGKIIVLSGVIDSPKHRAYAELGVRTIIEKPFQVMELIRTVQRELAG